MIYFIVHGFLIHIHGYLCYAWFYSFIFMVYFQGKRESGIWMHNFTFIFSSPKGILCFNNSRQCSLAWRFQPLFHLKFADDVMPSISSTISHNFAVSNQRLSWRSRMSFALHSQVIGLGLPPGTFSSL